MSTLERAGLQNGATGRLASQSDQSIATSVIPPFSGKLNIDENLKLTRENFQQLIEDFFRDNNVLPSSQLTTPISFPTPHVLTQFASKVYTDYKTEETDAQYEKRLALPDGWKLLTTASNGSLTNGYFGAAYWHPEHQQVVIAHRGNANLAALWTDLKGVLLNKCVGQMESASTFAHKVVEVLQEVNETKRVSFQLFFTGHSSGGWLAQITTFTTEYLKKEGNNFLKSNYQNCYHPHTVVFDSPGCKDMLSQMTNIFDVRLYGRSIDLKHLDITSYLSAPNRINTCNAHLGTVLRIFPDFSNMSWKEQHTLSYNLATHRIEKIVETFDPETGQVQRDEQGKLKVQVVVDWPLSTGLTGGEEYNSFFEWAQKLNNYHPDITNESFQKPSYSPIRYQTKCYDEGMNSVSIFSEVEHEFLQSYLWLRQWPEFCKPKELFSVMEDNNAEEYAEKMLHSFEIEKDRIRCRDASELQALIPYVKRLLQLFPQIKGNTKCDIRRRFYQFETRRYVELIEKSPIKFNFDASNFREFLESEQQVLHLQICNGDEWTGLIKVYQALQTNTFFSEVERIVLKLKRFLTVNQWMDLSTLMQSTVNPYLLLIACEDNQLLDEETKDTIRTLFQSIQQKKNIKIILITRTEDKAVSFLHYTGRKMFVKGFVGREEQLTWWDLTSSSQEKLLEKPVKFQDAKIALNKLMSAESPVAQYLSLGALLEEGELKIADPVPISNAYKELYYLGRTLRHQKVIKQDIFNDKSVRDSHIYLASTEQEFKQLCQLYPKSNVHWIEKDKSGELVWQQSQGSLEKLREYIDTESSQTYTADDLDKLLGQAVHQKVMLISDTAGMGKSTVLTHLSQQIKEKSPEKWVVRINLNEHTDALNALKEELIDEKKAIEFVSEKVLKLKPGLEMELLKECFEKKQKVRIVIMLDGFDEISPFYKKSVIDLLQNLRQTAVEQLWVTTRPHLRRELEDTLQQLSYTLENFSVDNQVQFLTNFWGQREWFTERQNRVDEEGTSKLTIYADELTKKLAQSISDKDKHFTGIALQCRMLAEAFDKEVKTFCQSDESIPDLPSKLDLLGLYGKFIERKYEIYQKEKCQVSLNNVFAIEQRERDLKNMRDFHQVLALQVLLSEEKVIQIENDSRNTDSADQLTRIGIAEINSEGKMCFIHRTFAEYYAADYFVNHLEQNIEPSRQLQEYLLKYILLKPEFRVVRVFIDGLLSKYTPSKEVLQRYGNRIREIREDCESVLCEAARDCNAEIIGFILHSLEAAGHTDILKQLLLAQDNDRQTAWQLAVFWGNTQVLEKIWEFAKRNVRKEELNKTYLLDKDSKEKTVWHVATQESNLMVLQKLWDWAIERLTLQDLKGNLLLAGDNKGRTAWHIAAQSGNAEIVQKIWDCAKQKLTPEELKSRMLLATENLGQTALHYATRSGNIHLLEKVWQLAEESLTREELNNHLLLATNKRRQTAWYVAAERGNLELLQKLWGWAKEKLDPEDLKNKFLLTKEKNGQTTWHVAAEWGNLQLLEKLLEWAKDVLTPEEINDKLLLAGDENKQIFLHVAANRTKNKDFAKLWDWAKKTLNKEDIRTLLLAKDDHEQTVFNAALYKLNADVFEKLWEWAEANLDRAEIKELFSAEDDHGQAVMDVVKNKANTEVYAKLFQWAEKHLTPEKSKSGFRKRR